MKELTCVMIKTLIKAKQMINPYTSIKKVKHGSVEEKNVIKI